MKEYKNELHVFDNIESFIKWQVKMYPYAELFSLYFGEVRHEIDPYNEIPEDCIIGKQDGNNGNVDILMFEQEQLDRLESSLVKAIFDKNGLIFWRTDDFCDVFHAGKMEDGKVFVLECADELEYKLDQHIVACVDENNAISMEDVFVAWCL